MRRRENSRSVRKDGKKSEKSMSKYRYFQSYAIDIAELLTHAELIKPFKGSQGSTEPEW